MDNKYYVPPNHYEGRYENIETIEESTIEMDFRKDNFEQAGVPIISNGELARGYPLEEPFMIVAGTGSGKTRRLIMQFALSNIKAGNPFVIHDPKGEHYKHLAPELEKHGYKVFIYNLRNPEIGERYNLCEYPAILYKTGKKRRADELFQGLIDTFIGSVKSEKEPYWHTTSATHLSGVAELVCDLTTSNNVTINNIYNVHLQGCERMYGSNAMKEYFKKHEDKSYWKLIAPYANAPTETRQSLDSVLTSAISPFVRNESIVDQALNSTFEVADLVEEKTALFIITRDESSVYDCLVSALIDQIYEIVIDIAEEKYNGRLKRKLSFILDEFGNLPAINNINSKITVSRSRNVSWMLCCQSLEQLNLVYGADIAKIIIGNCNLAYMYSSDINLLKMISELCGKTTDEITHEEKYLLSVEQLRHFNKKDGQTLFLLERLHPFIGYLPDISQYGIIPMEAINLPIREKQDFRPLDFKSIVVKEHEGALKQKSQEIKAAFGNRIPTFEEFMAEMKKKEEGALDIDKTIKEIDERIAEIDAEEAIENFKKKRNLRDIEIIKMESAPRTARVLSPVIGLSENLIKIILKKASLNERCVIGGIPKENMEQTLLKLNSIGTIAKEVN